jgi:hypothetical protein
MTKTAAKKLGFKLGNAKVDSSCIIFNLPTEICPVQCGKRCYAKRPEQRFPEVLASRRRNLEFTKSQYFITNTIAAIKTLGKSTCRPHESGDFYSQEYINAWTEIATACPEVAIYTYSKTFHLFDFSRLTALENVNIINSSTAGYNFGTAEYCKDLQAEGYFLCPCGTDAGKNIKCMKQCRACTHKSKVCFIEH